MSTEDLVLFTNQLLLALEQATEGWELAELQKSECLQELTDAVAEFDYATNDRASFVAEHANLRDELERTNQSLMADLQVLDQSKCAARDLMELRFELQQQVDSLSKQLGVPLDPVIARAIAMDSARSTRSNASAGGGVGGIDLSRQSSLSAATVSSSSTSGAPSRVGSAKVRNTVTAATIDELTADFNHALSEMERATELLLLLQMDDKLLRPKWQENRNELEQAKAEMDKLAIESKSLQLELEQARKEVQSVTSQLDRFKANSSSASYKIESMRGEEVKLREELERLKQKLANQAAEMDDEDDEDDDGSHSPIRAKTPTSRPTTAQRDYSHLTTKSPFRTLDRYYQRKDIDSTQPASTPSKSPPPQPSESTSVAASRSSVPTPLLIPVSDLISGNLNPKPNPSPQLPPPAPAWKPSIRPNTAQPAGERRSAYFDPYPIHMYSAPDNSAAWLNSPSHQPRPSSSKVALTPIPSKSSSNPCSLTASSMPSSDSASHQQRPTTAQSIPDLSALPSTFPSSSSSSSPSRPPMSLRSTPSLPKSSPASRLPLASRNYRALAAQHLQQIKKAQSGTGAPHPQQYSPLSISQPLLPASPVIPPLIQTSLASTVLPSHHKPQQAQPPPSISPTHGGSQRLTTRSGVLGLLDRVRGMDSRSEELSESSSDSELTPPSRSASAPTSSSHPIRILSLSSSSSSTSLSLPRHQECLCPDYDEDDVATAADDEDDGFVLNDNEDDTDFADVTVSATQSTNFTPTFRPITAKSRPITASLSSRPTTAVSKRSLTPLTHPPSAKSGNKRLSSATSTHSNLSFVSDFSFLSSSASSSSSSSGSNDDNLPPPHSTHSTHSNPISSLSAFRPILPPASSSSSSQPLNTEEVVARAYRLSTAARQLGLNKTAMLFKRMLEMQNGWVEQKT